MHLGVRLVKSMTINGNNLANIETKRYDENLVGFRSFLRLGSLRECSLNGAIDNMRINSHRIGELTYTLQIANNSGE